ncbi:hypothetical protein Pfo_021728 [Paulownia fortunei]|nr:hypothetical protein Pfo_021728 [Paulownia fortunei]
MQIDRNAFAHLCFLLENVGGLDCTRHIQISEQVGIFLTVLAYHKKNRVAKFDFKRFGYTISKHLNVVLTTLLRLHTILIVNPEPVEDGCTNKRWKWFNCCLGALDDTYIKVRVPQTDKTQYRNKKRKITINILGVCDENIKFVYILSDAISRPNGLRVPSGNYYQCDCGYTNDAGFLAPYRGVRYYLDEWDEGTSAPQNYRELSNLKHAKVCNVIERSFGLLKSRWTILRSNFYYLFKTQNCIIMVCCLLHNFIRTAMAIDPLETELPEYMHDQCSEENDNFVEQVKLSQLWTTWRDNLTMAIYDHVTTNTTRCIFLLCDISSKHDPYISDKYVNL